MRRFGEKLRELRNRHGLTLNALAENLGYKTHGYISEIEVGRKTPSVAFLLAVADFFDVSVDELVKDDVEVGIQQETAGETTATPGTPFAHRPPSDEEIERLRLILSTYQDGTGMLASDGGVTLPGWRDFERSVALAFGGVASESKDIFDVRLPDPQRTGVFFGISCKMREALSKLDREGRAYMELSNSSKRFWDYLNTKGLDQSNYESYPADVGAGLIDLVSQWHQDASLEGAGNVDISESCYLALSWNKTGLYQLHQFPIAFPEPSGLHWEIRPTAKSRCLLGNDESGRLFEWYGESGGQLKYYPLEENAIWKSSRFMLEPIPSGLEHGVLHKARTYFPAQWQNLSKPDGNP